MLVRFSVLCLVFLGLLFKLYNLFGVKLCKRNCELQPSVPLGSPCLVGVSGLGEACVVRMSSQSLCSTEFPWGVGRLESLCCEDEQSKSVLHRISLGRQALGKLVL